MDGVVLAPSAFGITVGSPPSNTATHEFVVPKSIPIILAIYFASKYILSPKSLFWRGIANFKKFIFTVVLLRIRLNDTGTSSLIIDAFCLRICQPALSFLSKPFSCLFEIRVYFLL
jgi:hypothetical protein